MSSLKADRWSAQQSSDLYHVERWANDYFSINEAGKLCAQTLHSRVPLLDIVEDMVERDLSMPVLLRIENILDAQIKRLNEAFKQAITEQKYQGHYRGVFPIKVNQQAQVVEEVVAFGERYQHGLEVGSKPEMIAALATLEKTGSLIICNGYKDQEFIDLGLDAIKLGFDCFFVIETTMELPIIIARSKALKVTPKIGIRAKMTTSVSGHWNATSGERSVFGLSSMQMIDVIDQLKEAKMLSCLQLLHCHLGSQIPNIQDIRSGIIEACRYYADLINEGAALSHIDLGGGLAVDYTGSQSHLGLSRNYSLEEYCHDIVKTLKQTLDEYHLEHPIIITESGRATVAYSSVLLFNVLDTTNFASTQIPKTLIEKNVHPLISHLQQVLSHLSIENIQQSYNDANFYHDETKSLFKRGQISLRARAIAENIFLDILQKISEQLDRLDNIPKELSKLKLSLADIYYGNFSLFQSLPDVWAIDQHFPVMPIHRLNEYPSRNAMIADITCDCDGKIDSFINSNEEQRPTLPLHPLKDDEEYYIGVFLVGAYQETLGDLHNLFGDTHIISVRLNENDSFEVMKEVQGDSIADVLSYVEYQPKLLQTLYQNKAERAVKEGRITTRERQQMLRSFNDSLAGYTYYEK